MKLITKEVAGILKAVCAQLFILADSKFENKLS